MSMVLMTILAASVIGGLDHNVVTPAWLQERLDDPNVVLVEIGATPDGNHAHIPGARYVRIDSIVKRGSWPPDELPPVDELRRAFGNAGVGDDGQIVLYSTSPVYATRAWFTLDYLGQGDRVSILDGGFARWTAEHRPVTSKRPRWLAKTFTPYPDPSRLVSLDEMMEATLTGAVLLDARPEREYHGDQRGEAVTRRGHIPGAACAPWTTNYAKDQSFLPASTLAAKYEKLIPARTARVIVYCRTGMDATVPYFILRSLGYNVALHDGSYTEWSRDPALPIAKLSPKP